MTDTAAPPAMAAFGVLFLNMGPPLGYLGATVSPSIVNDIKDSQVARRYVRSEFDGGRPPFIDSVGYSQI